MNPSTALATVLVDELVRNRVHDVVLAPGSRSAPLAFALHAADTAGRLRLHVRVDERSAGFLALGLAKAAESPVAVVTTSGTATANLHPAVLEAHQAGVPLLVLTADRPPEMRGVGANQTTDQLGMYGAAVRLFHEVGAPHERPGEVGYWRALACRAVLTARGALGGDPGPVHLNLALREPLAPDGSDSWEEPLAGRPDGLPWTTAGEEHPPTTSVPVGELGEGPRTLLVAGPLSRATAQDVSEIAAVRGWPLVAEPTSRAWGDAVPHGPLLLGCAAWLEQHLPARVVVVGRPTLARSVQRLLRDPRVDVDVVVETPRWYDPALRARRVLPGAVLGSAADASAADASDPSWSRAWYTAGRRVSAAVAGVLPATGRPTGPGVARTVVDSLPADALLVLGSSSPVRDVDLSATPRADVAPLSNRGASGIDGTVSTAIGAALVHDGPGYALLGDLTFLHDGNGLLIAPHERRPDLCLVVVNDDGGGVFHLLEQGAPEHAAVFERVFGTPHGVDLGALCAATGTPYELADDLAELRTALAPRPGLRVVEVRVERRDRRDLHARLQAAVSHALDSP